MVVNFDIIEKNVGDIKVIKVIGELDALVAPKLKERITKLVEMDNTKFIKLNENIKTIFEMIGLDEIFEIYETEEEAVASFK